MLFHQERHFICLSISSGIRQDGTAYLVREGSTGRTDPPLHPILSNIFCVYERVCGCIVVGIYVFVCICMYVCMCDYVGIYIYIYMCVCVFVCMYYVCV